MSARTATFGWPPSLTTSRSGHGKNSGRPGSMRRAMEHVPEGTDASWLRGIELTLQKLHDVLASVGVEPIEAVGAPFDPKLHEAIGSEESTELPEGTVVSELRRGYRTHDRVLRPSLVKLARRQAADEASTPHGSPGER